MPLQRRIPKVGFNNLFRTEYQIVNLYQLEQLKTEEKISIDLLRKSGFIKKRNVPVKILGEGEITHKIEIEAHAFSSSAEAKIVKAGGKVVKI